MRLFYKGCSFALRQESTKGPELSALFSHLRQVLLGLQGPNSACSGNSHFQDVQDQAPEIQVIPAQVSVCRGVLCESPATYKLLCPDSGCASAKGEIQTLPCGRDLPRDTFPRGGSTIGKVQGSLFAETHPRSDSLGMHLSANGKTWVPLFAVVCPEFVPQELTLAVPICFT